MRDEGPPPVCDPATGEIRIAPARCSTCILRPAGERINLSPARIRDFVGHARDADTHVICHQSLDSDRGVICRGFADAYGLPTAVRHALAYGGHLVEVDPEATE